MTTLTDFRAALAAGTEPTDRLYDAIGDYLAVADWRPQEILPELEELARRVGQESSRDVLEALLNALVQTVSRGKPIPPQTFEPVAAALPHLPVDLLTYGFEVLAQCHHAPFAFVIEPYLHHPLPWVRQEATDALVELAGRMPTG